MYLSWLEHCTRIAERQVQFLPIRTLLNELHFSQLFRVRSIMYINFHSIISINNTLQSIIQPTIYDSLFFYSEYVYLKVMIQDMDRGLCLKIILLPIYLGRFMLEMISLSSMFFLNPVRASTLPSTSKIIWC